MNLNLVTPDGQRHTLPLTQAFDPHGAPAPLANDTLTLDCNHTGQTWSQDFDLRCTRCGCRLFLPPRYLAYRAARELEHAYLLWRAAGWPQWQNSTWYAYEDWPRVAHPLYAAVGGIPVNPARRAEFAALAQAFAEE